MLWCLCVLSMGLGLLDDRVNWQFDNRSSPLSHMTQRLTDAEIAARLGHLTNWSRAGEAICCTFTFESFPKAIGFVTQVAFLAEQAQHHPDIDIRYSRVTLALTTHDADGLTEQDFALAAQIDALLQ